MLKLLEQNAWSLGIDKILSGTVMGFCDGDDEPNTEAFLICSMSFVEGRLCTINSVTY
jgi:hypothetical protein